METLASVSVYERNLSPETSTTKVHRDMGFQQGAVFSEKSQTKWLTQFQVNDIGNSNLVDNLSWKTCLYTTYAQSVVYTDQSHDKVIFPIID